MFDGVEKSEWLVEDLIEQIEKLKKQKNNFDIGSSESEIKTQNFAQDCPKNECCGKC